MRLLLKSRSGEDVHSHSHEGLAPDIVIYGDRYGERYWIRAGISEKQALYVDASVLVIHAAQEGAL